MSSARCLALLPAMLGIAACGDLDDEDLFHSLSWPLTARCKITVAGKGTKDLEADYLPHVITCENGGADLEALKVQAVSARTFAYYKIATAGSVRDGTSDQVYSCGSQPAQKHFEAVKATAGEVLVWSNVVICSFFVAGAKPSTQSCVALASDPDPTGTEKYVTYNAGKAGSQVKQSSLGWISPSNKFNRGCMSQNGSHCQAIKGKKYRDILRFYYGADIQIQTATGPCVPSDPEPDSSAARRDGGARKLDGRRALDGGPQPGEGPAAGPLEAGPPRLESDELSGGCAVARGPGTEGSLTLIFGVALLGLLRRRRHTTWLLLRVGVGHAHARER